MKKFFECAACCSTVLHTESSEQWTPFCSMGCETSFSEHAPISLLNKVYQDYKEGKSFVEVSVDASQPSAFS